MLRALTVPAGRIAMPGPVNSDRLLALELEDRALADYAGLVAVAT
jgi:predicted N-acetyltransferase YhbS